MRKSYVRGTTAVADVGNLNDVLLPAIDIDGNPIWAPVSNIIAKAVADAVTQLGGLPSVAGLGNGRYALIFENGVMRWGPLGPVTTLSAITDSDIAPNSVSENAANGTAVGITAVATHDGRTITYSLTDSALGKFAINASTGVVTKAAALSFATNASHTITVQAASSDAVSTTTASFTIAVVAAQAAVTSGFVYREGPKLMLDKEEWKFVGFNDFSLTGCHTGSPPSEVEMASFFAALRPRTLTRTWAFSHSSMVGIDRVVAAAETYNQKVMLVLHEGAGHCGSPGYNRAWYAGGYATDGIFYPHIDYLCNRFKNSPAVIWEISNEPGQASGGDMTQAECKAFLNNAAARIKAADPNHLVSTGCIGSWRAFHSGQAAYADVHNSQYIDLVTSHEYEYDYNGNTGRQGRHSAELAAAVSLNKPIFIGEFGCARSSGTAPATRATVCTQKFDAYLDPTYGKCAGALMWAATSPPNNGDGTVFSMAANEPYGGPVLTAIKSYTNAQLPVYGPNFLTKSEQLNVAPPWELENATVDMNATTGPFGNLVADRIVQTGTAVLQHGVFQQGYTAANGQFTGSAYLKADSLGYGTVYLSDYTTGAVAAFVNLSTGALIGAVGTGSWTGVSASVVDAGGGWWRVIVTGTRGAGSQTVLFIVTGDGTTNLTFAGTPGQAIFATAAQVQPGAVATRYMATA